MGANRRVRKNTVYRNVVSYACESKKCNERNCAKSNYPIPVEHFYTAQQLSYCIVATPRCLFIKDRKSLIRINVLVHPGGLCLPFVMCERRPPNQDKAAGRTSMIPRNSFTLAFISGLAPTMSMNDAATTKRCCAMNWAIIWS